MRPVVFLLVSLAIGWGTLASVSATNTTTTNQTDDLLRLRKALGH